MLSNKSFKYIYLIFLFTSIACGDKDESDNQIKNTFDYNNPSSVLKAAKDMLGDEVKFSYSGIFDADSIIDIAAGTEIVDDAEWGIKFHLLKQDEGNFIKDYETDLMDGSFSECLIQKIKFPSINHELIYYNSLDYYLGSGGGEIFSYIVDFNNKQVYYAHLFTGPRQPVSLYLSDNIQTDDVKNFFVANFKRDYPALKIVTEDVDLKY